MHLLGSALFAACKKVEMNLSKALGVSNMGDHIFGKHCFETNFWKSCATCDLIIKGKNQKDGKPINLLLYGTFGECEENIEKSFFSHCEVTIDGQLFPCRCRCAFIQYMPQKPSKFGIKFWLLSGVMTFYVLKAVPCLGKEGFPNDVGVAEDVVMTLMEPYLKTGLTETSDNFFTLLKTARKLLQNNITMVRTVWSNKNRSQVSFTMHANYYFIHRDSCLLKTKVQ